MTLARRTVRLPEIAAALETGTIGLEAAALIARIASPRTVSAWLERAARRTVLHLRQEIEIAEAIARAEGDRRPPMPPDEPTIAGFEDFERAMLDGRAAAAVANGRSIGEVIGESSQMSAAGPSREDGDLASQMSAAGPARDGDPASQMSAKGGEERDADRLRPGAGRVQLRLDLTGELARFWRGLERLFRESGEAGSFEDFLLRSFWRSWLVDDPDSRVAYHHIYKRDAYVCRSPVCNRRDLTPHHLVFRSRGGGEEDENLVSLCVRCHLELLHAGKMDAEPPASRVRWTIGRAATLVVHGREKVG